MSRKANAAGALVFSAGPVTGATVVDTSPILSFSLLVQNTGLTDTTIQSIAANIFGNGIQVGAVNNLSAPVVVPAGKTVSIPVAATLQPVALANDILTAFSNQGATPSVTVQGTASAGNTLISVNVSLQIV